MGKALDTTLAVLNGVVGDHLARTRNGLVTSMSFAHEGVPVSASAALGAQAHPTERAVVLVHGLMSTEAIWRFEDGSDYGTKLAQGEGFTPFYLRYNTGLPIADNGAALAASLDSLAQAYLSSGRPLHEILMVGHSMGGLVIRSACHVAARDKRAFLPYVHSAMYVGTPHLGAPYERFGRVVSAILRAVNDPYTKLIADIADLRSAGLQDLGDADLRHEDRAGRSLHPRLSDWQHPVPLLPQIEHYLVAGSLGREPFLAALFGDSVVPVRSALAGSHAANGQGLQASHLRVLPGLSHLRLAHDAGVYAQIREWLSVSA